MSQLQFFLVFSRIQINFTVWELKLTLTPKLLSGDHPSNVAKGQFHVASKLYICDYGRELLKFSHCACDECYLIEGR